MAKHLPEGYTPDDNELYHSAEPEIGENEPSLKFPRRHLDNGKNETNKENK